MRWRTVTCRVGVVWRASPEIELEGPSERARARLDLHIAHPEAPQALLHDEIPLGPDARTIAAGGDEGRRSCGM